jgi:hypothetical protein
MTPHSAQRAGSAFPRGAWERGGREEARRRIEQAAEALLLRWLGSLGLVRLAAALV